MISVSITAEQEITIDKREEIFDRFYQTDGDKKDSFGIGLHLSREIFRMHQGTVRVLESDETGTTFQILLPIFTAKDAGQQFYRIVR